MGRIEEGLLLKVGGGKRRRKKDGKKDFPGEVRISRRNKVPFGVDGAKASGVSLRSGAACGNRVFPVSGTSGGAERRPGSGRGGGAAAPPVFSAPPVSFPLSPYANSFLKRAFDFLLAGLGILLAAPLWVLIPLFILAEDGRPVFYVQERVGRGGKVFRFYKFRSMVKDAEKMTGPVLAGAKDPRVTRAGRILRATALDELPQLFHIFRGEMSFVGPRPERPELAAAFAARLPEYGLRHAVRPGLTGLAQIFGHYASPPEEKLAYDLRYLREASFLRDLWVIRRSFGVTFAGKWQERRPHVRETLKS